MKSCFRGVLSAFFFLAGLASLSGQTLTTLYNFLGGTGDGAQPTVGLVQAADGNFYGLTSVGGTHSEGTAFRITPGGTLTIIHNFNGTDGIVPESPIILGSDGNIYGTAGAGGGNSGTVFKLTLDGTFTVLHAFNGNDGAGPTGLIQASDGNFYGTTSAGIGGDFYGTVFKLTPGGTLTTLHAFQNTDGSTPESGVIQGSDGNFYGTTKFGGTGCGTNGCGTVFKMTPSGSLTTLHFFNGTDGVAPLAAPFQAVDGNYYGTTYGGGGNGGGVIYKVTSTGTFTTVYQFCAVFDCPDGFGPAAPLIQATDGNFYGTTTGGGTLNYGTVFKVTPGGVLTSQHLFIYTDGAEPYGAVLQATDGNFYGTTLSGGSHSWGTVFALTGPGLISTTTTLTTNPNPSRLSQTVTMTATVHAQGSTPSGNVIFSSDGVAIGTVPLTNGVAVLNFSSLPLGTHSISAQYQGGSGFAGSTSNTVQQVVQIGQSTTAVTSTPNPSIFGQQVTITATVGPSGPPPPSGTVSFTSNGTAISGCTAVSLISQMAQCVTSALPVGTDAIVATYSGDSNYNGSNGSLSQIVNPVPTPVQFVTLTPCRVVDTRSPNGQFGGPAIQGGTARSFPLPQGACGIPANASVFSLNITVVPHGRLGYLTIWPTGEGQPQVSTMNSDGRTKANAAIVPAGTGGAVSVYVSDTTDVVLDINGYFETPQSQTYQFYPLSPCRLVDTRSANGHLGGPYLNGGAERDFPLLESPCISQLPLSPQAYSLNVTVLPNPQGQHLGYLTVWPAGGAQPGVSTLNNPTSTNVANAAIVPAGTGGAIAVYPSQSTDLLIDINGYFATPGTGGMSLYATTPCRVLDTRSNNGHPFSGELAINVIGSACAPPVNSQAYVFNATAIPSGPLGYLTLWPDGQDQPNVSTLNARDGAVTSNMAIVPTDNGSIDAFASALTHLILDISGYFAP